MSTATEPRRDNPFAFDLGLYNDAVSRSQDLSARIMEGVKSTSLTSLDAYDRVVQAVTDLQVKMADASQMEWLAAPVRAQATLVREMNAAYTSAVRAALS